MPAAVSGANRIALLRAVNVGGTGKLRMAELKALADALGLARARTLRGNLVFASDDPPEALEAQLETVIAERLGVACAVFVRTAEEWRDAVAANPLTEAAASRPSTTLIYAMRDPPAEAQLARVRATGQHGERVEAVGRHVYIDYGPSVGLSKLAAGRLGLATGRNWNTALKLAALTT